jgi:hypothetical protein
MYRESYFEKIFVIAKTNVAITMSGKCFTLPSIPLYAPILAYNQGCWNARNTCMDGRNFDDFCSFDHSDTYCFDYKLGYPV